MRFILNTIGNDCKHVDGCDAVTSTNNGEDGQQQNRLERKHFVERRWHAISDKPFSTRQGANRPTMRSQIEEAAAEKVCRKIKSFRPYLSDRIPKGTNSRSSRPPVSAYAVEGGAHAIVTKDDGYEPKETSNICNILLDGVKLAKSLLDGAS